VSVQEVAELFDDLGTVVNDLFGADEFTSLVDVDLNVRVHNSSDLFSILVDVGDDLGSQDFSDNVFENFTSLVDVDVNVSGHDSSDLFSLLVDVGDDLGSRDFFDNFASFVDVDLARLDSSDVAGVGVGSDVSYATVGFMARVTGTAVADVRGLTGTTEKATVRRARYGVFA
jgi:hypothetical protein